MYEMIIHGPTRAGFQNVVSFSLFNILALFKLYYLVAGAQFLIDSVEKFKTTMSLLNIFTVWSKDKNIEKKVR